MALKGIGLSLILDPDDVSSPLEELRFKIVTEPLLFEDAIVSNSYVIICTYIYIFLLLLLEHCSRDVFYKAAVGRRNVLFTRLHSEIIRTDDDS